MSQFAQLFERNEFLPRKIRFRRDAILSMHLFGGMQTAQKLFRFFHFLYGFTLPAFSSDSPLLDSSQRRVWKRLRSLLRSVRSGVRIPFRFVTLWNVFRETAAINHGNSAAILASSAEIITNSSWSSTSADDSV